MSPQTSIPRPCGSSGEHVSTGSSSNGSAADTVEMELENEFMGPCIPEEEPERKEVARRTGGGRPSISITVGGARPSISFTVLCPNPLDLSQSSESEDVSLLCTSRKSVKIKNFSEEVRAGRDVDRFLSQAAVLLDLPSRSLESTLCHMLESVLEDNPCAEPREARCSLLKRALFTDMAQASLHGTVHLLSETIQAVTVNPSGLHYQQSWLCVLCTETTLQHREVCIARLERAQNWGENCCEVRFVILVLAPPKSKSTKTATEVGRTFATIFVDIGFRQQLIEARSPEEFKHALLLRRHDLTAQHEEGDSRIPTPVLERPKATLQPNQPDGSPSFQEQEDSSKSSTERSIVCTIPGMGIWEDIRRRLPYYSSDFTDGILRNRCIGKYIIAMIFLYFACLLPSIAFGSLNDINTRGAIDVQKTLVAQSMGGVLFAVLSGQPLIVLLTTAPLALYIYAIRTICDEFELDFHAYYACIGLWNSFFLTLYALLHMSTRLHLSKRSIEEIFALFISIAFVVDAIKDIIKIFKQNYLPGEPGGCGSAGNNTSDDGWEGAAGVDSGGPKGSRDVALLALLLMLGTVWLGSTLYQFRKRPYLHLQAREILSDCAMPLSVIAFSFLGSYVFRDIDLTGLKFSYTPSESYFALAPLNLLTVGSICSAMGIGFLLSILFFMEHTMAASLTNAPHNRLKKGTSYHWDLLLVAVLNATFSLFGLPWMHAAFPHSPLHVRALATVEERVEDGHVDETIVCVRETRVPVLLAHMLLGLSLFFLLPLPLQWIPRPVLDGIFLYIALTSLDGNQLFQRLALLFTEQTAYPPTHYVRRVPQRKIHYFTGLQLLQLAVLCGVGFSPIPYMKMVFPVIMLAALPVRFFAVPKIIESRYLDVMDEEL
ncbi:solute carrier family 4 member 11 isoform X1 [Petromyzon marinus]|uniref:Sodium bicarbonate transporter-like protein 11 isoform X1 n=2 Tax=Petromyzon marinus TaxID=7757 RepID=A0AAJ7WQB7_PETMA|nr:sodium bicarbonate transporter-like protein 11 isoform X1 [Petromyzon marinus]